MPKILINYTYNKKNDKFTLLENNEYVFADMPIAEMELGQEFEGDVLIVPINERMTVVDKEEYLKINKLFNLAINEDGEHLHEDPKGKISLYLPKDTPVERLVIKNGQLLLEEQEEVKNEEPIEVEGETA